MKTMTTVDPNTNTKPTPVAAGAQQMTSSSWAASIVASYNDGSDNDSILITNSARSNERSSGPSASASASASRSMSAGSVPDDLRTGRDNNNNNNNNLEEEETEMMVRTPRHDVSAPVHNDDERIAKTANDAIPPGPPPDSPHDLSSAKSSPFRRSLDEEARAKDRQRRIARESADESKRLLRDSVLSLSSAVDASGQSVLTRPERNFLEMLLSSDGPDAAEACAAAHRRLMDGNLFWAMCGGSAGEVNGMIPGHGWTVQDSMGSAVETTVRLKEGGSSQEVGPGSDDWVEGWVSRGSQSSNESKEKEKKMKKKNESKENDGVQQQQQQHNGSNPINFVPATEEDTTKEASLQKAHNQRSSSGASLGSSTNLLLRPYELERKSSEARLSRLQLRKRQSSQGGKDGTFGRLFRAHEAGLAITPHGSARRSLMRMGLPMEKGLYGAPPAPRPMTREERKEEVTLEKRELLDAPSPPPRKDAIEGANPIAATTVLAGDATLREAVSPTSFERALAKMDERTIRRIEKEEREKRAARSAANANANEEEDRMTTASGAKSPLMMGGGCMGVGGGGISPFSMSILRKMFASKQFSFHKASSSYSRFDSFLTSGTSVDGHGTSSGLFFSAAESERLERNDSTSVSTGLNSTDVSKIARMQKDIFRPSRRPSTPEERLKNLLINAGFRDAEEEDDDDSGDEDAPGPRVTDARAEDDLDVMSSSANSVALLLRGGPSYGDSSVFRGEVLDDDGGAANNDVPTEIPVKMKKKGGVRKVNLAIQTTVGSAVSSLGGSPPRKVNVDDDRGGAPSDEGAPRDEAKVSPTNSDLGELPALPSISRSGAGGLSQSAHSNSSSSRPSRSSMHKRSTTIGVLKSSSHSTNTSPPRQAPGSNGNNNRRRYKRSVSWGHMVFSKEEVRSSVASAVSRQDSTGTIASGGGATTNTNTTASVVSFPHLNRAVPLRSDSIGSNASTLLSYPPPLRLSVPLRSDSVGSVATSLSIMSPTPMLSRAHPVYSPRPSLSSSDVFSVGGATASTAPSSHGPPMLARAHSVRSESQRTVATTDVDDDECSLNSEEYVDARPGARGAAWESPLISGSRKGAARPPLHGARDVSSSAMTGEEGGEGAARQPKTFMRQASENNYEGVGFEVEEIPVPNEHMASIDVARGHRSLVSTASDYSTGTGFSRSHRSQRSSSGCSRGNFAIPLPQALDDSFIIKNINFERHSSEILRSLSNEDLYSSHHLETIHGASSKGTKNVNELSSTARVIGDLDSSWDLESHGSLNLAAAPSGVSGTVAPGVNAWGVLEDEYAEGYGAHDTLPFRILGTGADDVDCHPHVLSPPLMESLQNFMPPTISETNFWLKYSLVRDGASLPSLLRHVRGTKHALIAIETVEGEVFGSFTSSPWRKNWNYYGSGESFLWRMRRTRSEKDAQYSVLDQAKLESELDVFYWTGRNDLVQYCTQDVLAVGGGSLADEVDARDDAAAERRELPPASGPVLPSAASDGGGFGLAIDAELLRGTSSPCATFHSPPLSSAHANGSPFEILNIEVWTMTPCGNVAEAENLEMKMLFLDAYSRDI